MSQRERTAPAVEVGRRVKVLQAALFYNHHGTVTAHDPSSNPVYPWKVTFGPGMAYWYAEDELEPYDGEVAR